MKSLDSSSPKKAVQVIKQTQQTKPKESLQFDYSLVNYEALKNDLMNSNMSGDIIRSLITVSPATTFMIKDSRVHKYSRKRKGIGIND